MGTRTRARIEEEVNMDEQGGNKEEEEKKNG
jgi:hypothetical protein